MYTHIYYDSEMTRRYILAGGSCICNIYRARDGQALHLYIYMYIYVYVCVYVYMYLYIYICL